MQQSGQEATLPRTSTFGQYRYTDLGSLMTFLPVPALIGKLYTGIFIGLDPSTSNLLNVQPNCPTGNCTFPNFQSLAACSSCKDVVSAVNKTCSAFDIVSVEDNTQFSRVTTCTFALPDGIQLNQTVDELNWIDNTERSPETIVVRSHVNPVVAVDDAGAFLYVTFLQGNISSNRNMTIRASQCALSWCIKTYKTEVVNGQLHEEVLHSWYPGLEARTQQPASNYILQPPAMNSGAEPQISFVDGFASLSIETWLSKALDFSDSLAPRKVPNSASIPKLVPDVSSSFVGDDRMAGPVFDFVSIFRTSDPERILQNIAQTITTHIRSTNLSDENIAPEFASKLERNNITEIGPVKGNSYFVQVYIVVRWQWLAFSGTILVLNIIFFALIVAQSAKNNVSIWKSSPLPLIFHGLPSARAEHLEEIHEIDDMEKKAKGIRVQLRKTGQGIALEER
jgi:hypothetical protein